MNHREVPHFLTDTVGSESPRAPPDPKFCNSTTAVEINLVCFEQLWKKVFLTEGPHACHIPGIREPCLTETYVFSQGAQQRVRRAH